MSYWSFGPLNFHPISNLFLRINCSNLFKFLHENRCKMSWAPLPMLTKNADNITTTKNYFAPSSSSVVPPIHSLVLYSCLRVLFQTTPTDCENTYSVPNLVLKNPQVFHLHTLKFEKQYTWVVFEATISKMNPRKPWSRLGDRQSSKESVCKHVGHCRLKAVIIICKQKSIPIQPESEKSCSR